MLASITKNNWLVPLGVLIITGVLFRSLLLNTTSHLLDWNDFPYYVWTIDQQINHLRNGQIFSIGNGNIFYPHQGVMFFSDLLLPQAIIGTLLSFFTNNSILIFNLILFITFIANTLASFWLWRKFTTDWYILFFTTLATALSPFVFLQLGHVQMLSFWPFLIVVGLLMDQKLLSFKRSIWIGIWLTIQFLSSVYLAVFLIWTIILWITSVVWERWQTKQNVWSPLVHFAVNLGVFGILIAPFLYQYLNVQRQYNISRGYGEYVLYAAHVTDYLFQPYRSLLSQTLFAPWNKFNQHTVGELAGWPGFSLGLLALSGVIGWKHRKKTVEFFVKVDQQIFFWGGLLFSGWLFSLGPRLNVNGIFANIPLPYWIVMKIFPLVEPVRATSRWSFLLYFGLVYFALKGIQKISHQHWQKSIAIIAILVYLAEILPVAKQTEARIEYQNPAYMQLHSSCTNQSVLLEYPINRMVLNQDISQYLSYKTQIMLASTNHGCLLVNGYSGFTPKEVDDYELGLNAAVNQNDQKALQSLLDQKLISVIKLNLEAMNASESAQAKNMFDSLTNYQLLFNDSTSPVYTKL